MIASWGPKKLTFLKANGACKQQGTHVDGTQNTPSLGSFLLACDSSRYQIGTQWPRSSLEYKGDAVYFDGTEEEPPMKKRIFVFSGCYFTSAQSRLPGRGQRQRWRWTTVVTDTCKSCKQSFLTTQPIIQHIFEKRSVAGSDSADACVNVARNYMFPLSMNDSVREIQRDTERFNGEEKIRKDIVTLGHK